MFINGIYVAKIILYHNYKNISRVLDVIVKCAL